MKEQILILESTDDLHTVRDKIARAQAGRLVLMWNALEQPLRRRLDLVLMKRWAATTGAELAIVSADDEVGRLARHAGISCHKNLTESALAGLSSPSENSGNIQTIHRGRAPARIPARPGRPRPINPALRIGLFSAAVLSIAAVLLLLLPSARIHAVFPSRTVEAGGRLDQTLCSDITTRLTFAERRTTTGRILAPTAYAAGKVSLSNISSRALNLSVGLRVASESGIEFEVLEGFLLQPGKSHIAPARAVEPGLSGNLAAGKITRVLGPLALSLKAENPEAMSGGEEAWRNAVSTADWEALQDSLAEKIRNQASSSLQSLAGASRTVVEDSLRVEFDPLDQPDLPVNTPADTVGLTLHAAASLRACPADPVRMRAVEFLQSRLQPEETLSADGLSILLTENPEGGIDISAAGKAVQLPDPNAVAMALRFQSAPGAEAILRSRFQALEVIKIDLTPAWFPLLPLFPYQIEVRAAE